MKIGDRIFVRGYIDEIRKDTVIVRNDGGYFGTILSEVITGDLPSAQLELANNSPKVGKENGEWIPCSEKLPENGHYYLWCSDGGNVQSDYYWDGFENGKKFGYNIIAWMPLPEPYKEEQE